MNQKTWRSCICASFILKEGKIKAKVESPEKSGWEGAKTVNDVEMSRYILDTFKGVDAVVDSDNSFFFYNPDPNIPPDHMFPFVTLMTNDINDQFSNLNRPSVYRVNIGVGKQTFRSLFGGSSPRTEGDEKDDSGEKAESGDDDS